MSCDSILQFGIWDFTNIRTEDELFEKFIYWQNRNSQGSTQKSLDVSQAVNFIIPDTVIPVEYKMNASKKSSKEWKDFYQEYQQQDRYRRNTVNYEIRKANPDIISAWENCIVNKTGLKIWYTYVDDLINKSIIVHLQYRKPEVPGAANSIRIKECSCKDTAPMIGFPKFKSSLEGLTLDNVVKHRVFKVDNYNATTIIISAGGYDEVLTFKRVPVDETECVAPTCTERVSDKRTNNATVSFGPFATSRKVKITGIGRAKIGRLESANLSMTLLDEKNVELFCVEKQRPNPADLERFGHEITIEIFVPANIKKVLRLEVTNEQSDAMDNSSELAACFGLT